MMPFYNFSSCLKQQSNPKITHRNLWGVGPENLLALMMTPTYKCDIGGNRFQSLEFHSSCDLRVVSQWLGLSAHFYPVENEGSLFPWG